MMRLRWTLWAFVALVAGLFILFAVQLSRPKTELVQSAMIGEPFPQFALPAAVDGIAGLGSVDLADGQPKLVNIFASWCGPCGVEAPFLDELRRSGADIVGVAIRDRPEDVARFLSVYGNPFSKIGADAISEVQLSIGSSGVPETFVVDGNGVITYQHIGDVRSGDVPLLLEELRKAGGNS